MKINKYYQYNFKNNNFIKIKNKFKKLKVTNERKIKYP